MADIGEKLYFITMPELPWEPEAGSIARIWEERMLFKLLNLFTNWDYDVCNDAKNNEDLLNTAYYCVEVQLQNI